MIYIKRMEDCGLDTPRRHSAYAAGFDLQANLSRYIHLDPGESAMISTGFAWQIPEGYVGLLCPRSSLATKHNITIPNSPGVIDADYRGEVKVVLRNDSKQYFQIDPGMRIAQMVVTPVHTLGVAETFELDDTERGEGGFGSTGQ